MSYLKTGLKKSYIIGAHVLDDHQGGLSTNSAGYIKQRSITLDTLYPDPSTIRVSFKIGSNNGSTTVYGRIYKNGGAVGTERATTSMVGQTFTEDLSFAEGDIVQLYVHSNGSANLTTDHFQIHGTANIISLIYAIENTEIGVDTAFARTQSTP